MPRIQMPPVAGWWVPAEPCTLLLPSSSDAEKGEEVAMVTSTFLQPQQLFYTCTQSWERFSKQLQLSSTQTWPEVQDGHLTGHGRLALQRGPMYTPLHCLSNEEFWAFIQRLCASWNLVILVFPHWQQINNPWLPYLLETSPGQKKKRTAEHKHSTHKLLLSTFVVHQAASFPLLLQCLQNILQSRRVRRKENQECVAHGNAFLVSM